MLTRYYAVIRNGILLLRHGTFILWHSVSRFCTCRFSDHSNPVCPCVFLNDKEIIELIKPSISGKKRCFWMKLYDIVHHYFHLSKGWWNGSNCSSGYASCWNQKKYMDKFIHKLHLCALLFNGTQLIKISPNSRLLI